MTVNIFRFKKLLIVFLLFIFLFLFCYILFNTVNTLYAHHYIKLIKCIYISTFLSLQSDIILTATNKTFILENTVDTDEMLHSGAFLSVPSLFVNVNV